MEFKEMVLAKTSELPDGSMKKISVEGGVTLLINVEGESWH